MISDFDLADPAALAAVRLRQRLRALAGGQTEAFDRSPSAMRQTVWQKPPARRLVGYGGLCYLHDASRMKGT